MVRTLFGTALVLLAGAGAVTSSLAADGAQKAPTAPTRFQRADADKSGDLSLGEFAAMSDGYLAGADADRDGKMTVGEIADEIIRLRAERTAQRIVRRFDTDGDGAVSQAEMEARQKTRFTRLDKNADGKLSPDEMPKRKPPKPKK